MVDMNIEIAKYEKIIRNAATPKSSIYMTSSTDGTMLNTSITPSETMKVTPSASRSAIMPPAAFPLMTSSRYIG